MKKQYIEPTVAIYTVSITNMVAGIGSTAQKTDDPADEGFDGGGEGNTDAREDNIDNNRYSIWDNAW